MGNDVFESTAHVEQQLRYEFGDRVPESLLHRRAQESLARFDDARIIAFVPLLAVRDARARLRREFHDQASRLKRRRKA